MRAWQRLGLWLRRRLGGGRVYGTVYVDELPDVALDDMVYLVGEGPERWIAGLRCPCGCGEFLQMSLMRGGRPRWSCRTHWSGLVTLHPSIWRQKGCRSHFFLRGGRVDWCEPQRPRSREP